jgi:hypothetical protein
MGLVDRRYEHANTLLDKQIAAKAAWLEQYTRRVDAYVKQVGADSPAAHKARNLQSQIDTLYDSIFYERDPSIPARIRVLQTELDKELNMGGTAPATSSAPLTQSTAATEGEAIQQVQDAGGEPIEVRVPVQEPAPGAVAPPITPVKAKSQVKPSAKVPTKPGKKLPPGRYRNKKTGKTMIVDERGNQRFE